MFIRGWLCALVLCSISLQSHAEWRLVRVIDGDTMRMQYQAADMPAQTFNVRLLDIDAPELHQAGGVASRRSLQQLCTSVEMQLSGQHMDRYGRLLATVLCQGVDASLYQLEQGQAWYNTRYATRPLQGLEAQARALGLGLWADPQAEPPWRWRQRHQAYQRRT